MNAHPRRNPKGVSLVFHITPGRMENLLSDFSTQKLGTESLAIGSPRHCCRLCPPSLLTFPGVLPIANDDLSHVMMRLLCSPATRSPWFARAQTLSNLLHRQKDLTASEKFRGSSQTDLHGTVSKKKKKKNGVCKSKDASLCVAYQFPVARSPASLEARL